MCVGDNYVGCFPNLYAIRGTPYRDVTVWIETLKRMLTYDTEYFLPGHGPLLQTQAKIKKVIGINFISNIRLYATRNDT